MRVPLQSNCRGCVGWDFRFFDPHARNARQMVRKHVQTKHRFFYKILRPFLTAKSTETLSYSRFFFCASHSRAKVSNNEIAWYRGVTCRTRELSSSASVTSSGHLLSPKPLMCPTSSNSPRVPAPDLKVRGILAKFHILLHLSYDDWEI